LGGIRDDVKKTVTCLPSFISQPEAKILQPCGDPRGGAIFNNRHSTRPHAFTLEVRAQDSSWSQLHKEVVQGGDYFVTPDYYFPPRGMVRVRLGNGLVLSEEQVSEAGFYGWDSWECKVLDKGSYLNN
jgi:hypothetical protein